MLNQQNLNFGSFIKDIRERRGDSITKVANYLEVDRSYVSKLENGHEKASLPVLNKIISYFNLSFEQASTLASLLGYEGGGLVMLDNSRKEVKANMDEKDVNLKDKPKGVKINLMADKTPILYTDSVLVSSNQWGIILNVAQSIDDANQQIVTRIGMSRDHAKALSDVLAKHLAITSSNPNKQ